MKVGKIFKYYGNLGTSGLMDPDYTLVPVDFTDKVGLLLFIDDAIGSSWGNRLESIWSKMETFLVAQEIATTIANAPNYFHIVVVITNHPGSSSISTSPNYDVLMDADSLGETYRKEFLNITDDCFPIDLLTDVGNTLWGFIIDRNHKLADKWHDLGNTQTAGADTPGDSGDDVFSREPISFHHLSPTGYTSFDSADSNNIVAYTLERLKNLFRPPSVLSADPAIGSTFTTAGNLSTTRICFSRPITPAQVIDPMNYGISGGGGIGLSISINGIHYENAGLTQTNVGEIENEVTLDISKSDPQTLEKGTVRIDLLTTNLLTHNGDNITPNDGTKYAVTFNGPEIILADITPDLAIPLNTSTIGGYLTFAIPFTDPVYAYTEPLTDTTVFTTPLKATDISEGVSGISGFSAAANDPDNTGGANPYKQYSVTLDSSGWGGTGTLNFTIGADANRVITDRFGNPLRGTTSFSFSVDLDPPTAVILYPPDGSTVNNVTVRIQAVGAIEKRFIINGNPTIISNDFINLSDINGYSPLPNGGEFTLTLEAKDSGGNVTTHSINLVKETNIPKNMQPFHFVYVLDKSGSMNSDATFGVPSETYPKSIWVREALDAIVPNIMPNFGTDSDRYGMVLYSRNAITSLLLTPKGNITSTPAIFSDALDDNPQGSSTAMGAGLARALDLLSYTISDAEYYGRRAIVFFADGQQNVSPYVEFDNDSIPTAFTIETSGTTSGCPSGMGTINIPGSSDIPIHTMGIGGNGSWLDTLENISTVTGVDGYANNEIWPDASASLINITPSLFPTSSPQIVRNESESLDGTGHGKISFPLNSSVTKLVVYLEWPGGKELDMVLRKGDIEINFDKIIRNGRSVIGIIEFPHYQLKTCNAGDINYIEHHHFAHYYKSKEKDPSVISQYRPRFRSNGRFIDPSSLSSIVKLSIFPQGDWSVSVFSPTEGTGAVNRSYLLSVIADEKDYFYQVRWEGTPLFAGNPIDVSVLLSREKGLPPIKTSISVEVKSPSEAIINIVSNYKPQNTPKIPTDNVGGKAGELNARIEKLLTEPKLLASVRKKKITSIKLSQSPMNLMAGTVTGLTTQGYHKARVIIRHEDKKGGVYERVVDRTFKFSVCPDQKSSKIDIIKEGKFLQINVLPKDKYGNLLGPGYEKRFPRLFPGYKILDIADNLDGSYTLRTIPIGKNAIKPGKEEIFRYLFPG